MPVEADPDVVLAKASTARKCLAAIRGLRSPDAPPLEAWILQDVVVLNLQRACQACLDVANHLITANAWELPRSARHSFEIIRDAGVIDAGLAGVMGAAMGFRNVAVHNYAAIDPAIVEAIVADHLGDLDRFLDAVLAAIAR